MEPQNVERKLAAILSADVQGYSRLMGDDEVATIRTLTAYREVFTSLIPHHRGRVVDSPGDNLLAEFASVVDAVQCAVAIQQELKTRNAELPPPRRMEFRIGINLGDVVVEGERIYGDGVNIAARLQSLAEAGGVCISGSVYDQIETKLALGYEYRGEQTAKNISKPIRVYWVHEQPSDLTTNSQASPLPLLPEEQTKPSLAVLPFVNMSNDPEQEYFSDGMTEDLITDLSKLSGLFVISRNSVFLYKGKAAKPEQISKELGIQYLLEGSVRKAGNRVRVTAQLIDALTGYHLWAERYDGELQDIFAVQDEVTQQIVAALRVKLTEGEQHRARRMPTTNLEAYDYYLRGLDYHSQSGEAANTQAQQMFAKAITLDPQFAVAYAYLGWTHFSQWALGWSQDPQTLERTLELARQAIALDSSLPGGYRLSGTVHLWKKQYEQAIVEVNYALTLDPNCADGYAGLADVLNFSGKSAEAIPLVEKAMHLNPHYPIWYLWALGHAYYLTEQYEKAITTFKRMLIRGADFMPAYAYLAVIYSELGQDEAARAEGAEFLRVSPHDSLEVLRQRLPYKDPNILERVLSAASKAGLK